MSRAVSIAPKVAATIRRRGLLAPGDRVAIAVSGGPDSVALAWLLRELAEGAAWTIAGLVHVNHGLRGAESDADEAFCRALAARLACPIDVRDADVAARARAERRSIESVARDLRYACFDAAAGALAATVVATGHTLDDQAETVMLRLLTGAGTRGLSGVRARRGRYRRPLIDCRRNELRDWLVARGETFRTDTSNDDTSILRNRLRRDLMPVIGRVAPGGIRALARLADLAADDEAVLEGQAIDLLPGIVYQSRPGGTNVPPRDAPEAGPSGTQVHPGDDGAVGVQVSAAALAALPPAIARRVVRAVAASVAPGVRLSARHLETVRLLAASEKKEGRLDLPGLTIARRGARLAIGRALGAVVDGSPFEYVLPVPGSVDIPEARVTMTASVGTGRQVRAVDGRLDRAVLDASTIEPPLVVRNRRPGDRLRPLGAPGRRKVQDLFVDRKVPRQDRDRVPIVVDAAGRLVWVAGVAIAESCRVTAAETGVVILELRKSE